MNPYGRVPTLIIDGHTLNESVAIIEYLEETRKERPLLPSDAYRRAQVRRLVEIVNSGIQPMQNLSVLAKVEEKNRMEWGKHFVTKGMKALDELIGESRGKYCVGDEITVADCCLIPQVSALPRFEIDIEQFKNCKEIVVNLNLLPEFKAAHALSQPDANT